MYAHQKFRIPLSAHRYFCYFITADFVVELSIYHITYKIKDIPDQATC